MAERPNISPTCEVIIRPFGQGAFCGAQTTHWYPAMGGGTMALCALHAEPHLKYAQAMNLQPVGAKAE